MSSIISIKGIRDGLLVTLGEGDYDDLLQQLDTELAAKQEFLQGSRITLAVGKRPLQRHALATLQDLFARHRLLLWTVLADEDATKDAARDLALGIRLPGSQTDLDGRALRPTTPPAPTTERPISQPNGLVLKETLRSGRSVYHEGHVIIFGDVNPGAEVIATGDVMVWGRLRGLVHAGAMGDQAAVICALDLSPTQLRIADQIAISPDGRGRKPLPEQATIRDGRIVAEPWSTKN